MRPARLVLAVIDLLRLSPAGRGKSGGRLLRGVGCSCHSRGEMALPLHHYYHLPGGVLEEQLPMLTREARFWSGPSYTRFTGALVSPDFPLGNPQDPHSLLRTT